MDNHRQQSEERFNEVESMIDAKLNKLQRKADVLEAV